MDISCVQPCRPENSIEMMGLFVDFKTELEDLEDALELVESGKLFSSSFFNKFSAKRVGDGEDNSVLELQLRKESSKDKREWLVSITTKSVCIFHYDYRRWETTFDVCFKTLEDFKTVFEKQATSRVLLGYLDEFFINDGFEHTLAIPGCLFKKNPYLPEVFFDSYLSTSDISFFSEGKEELPVKSLFNVGVTPEPYMEEGKVVRHSVTIDTNVGCFASEDLPFSDFMQDEGALLKGVAQKAHDDLKKLFCEIVDDELLPFVGITTKGDV